MAPLQLPISESSDNNSVEDSPPSSPQAMNEADNEVDVNIADPAPGHQPDGANLVQAEVNLPDHNVQEQDPDMQDPGNAEGENPAAEENFMIQRHALIDQLLNTQQLRELIFSQADWYRWGIYMEQLVNSMRTFI